MRCKMFIALACALCVGACSSAKKQESIADVPEGEVFGQDELNDFLRVSQPLPQALDYHIGIGDRLDVVFFFHEDLTTKDLLVRDDGRITLPYVGDIMAAGQTPMRLDTLLTGQFGEILRDPNLSVIVRDTPDKIVYVLGMVENPGGYPYERQLSLTQALALANGLEYGSKNTHVLVIRRDGIDKIVGVEVDVKSILSGGAIQNDFLLRKYDIVYVPKTRLKSVADFSQLMWDIIQPWADLVVARGWTIYLQNRQLELLQQRN